MEFLRRRKLVLKLAAMLGVCLIGILVLIGSSLMEINALLLKDRQDKTRNLTESAVSILKHFQALEAAGKLSREEAQQQAKSVLRSVRYDEKEYFFIFNSKRVYQLLPPKPEWEGQDKTELADKNGKRFLVELVDAAVEGKGRFVQYAWPRSGTDVPVPKLSFAAHFAPWDWVIGTGIYIDDVDAAFAKYASSSGALGLSLLGLLGIACWLIARSITRRLGGEPDYAVEVVHRIAAGDLTVDVQVHARDDSSLLYSMKRMRNELQTIVSGIKHSGESIATATREVASGNADLSQRTEEQASSLEETASSMEELTSTVKQNAENARQANQFAAGASAMAVKGGEIVGRVVDSMASINESSKRIADITSVIDGIAFQTNILALNAAVEAARAGEQGRGFAVVASEVRTLAQRSAAAAKEIKALITDSAGKVDDGSRLVDQAGQTMQEMVAAVRRVTDIMAEIAAASQEQTAGIEQINQAVTQMDQVTQQNAALVEEAAAAADSMQQQAQSLTRAVAIFKLSVAEGAPHPNALPRHGERRLKDQGVREPMLSADDDRDAA